MYHLYILIPLNLICIGLYYRARLTNNLEQVRFLQPASVIFSLLIAAPSLLAVKTNASLAFSAVILAGMSIALVGDFLNVDMTRPGVVLRGLIIASLAYLTYAVGLLVLVLLRREDLWVGIPLLIFYIGFMIWLWPNLGTMRLPGLIYGLILPFLFWRATCTFLGGGFTVLQSLLLCLGTLSLYAGDIEFAIRTYKPKVKLLPVTLGPILYAGGQFLLALSVIAH